MECEHLKTHMVVNPLEYWIGESVEVCDACRMSRSHWEQGSSPWLRVPLCAKCDQPHDKESLTIDGLCFKCSN
jgi:hypothetical protein